MANGGHQQPECVCCQPHVLNRGGRGVRSPADGLAHPSDER